MFLLTKPKLDSVWIDHTLDITYLVLGFVSHGPSKGNALVSCRHGQRQWNDAMPIESFITELKEVK